MENIDPWWFEPLGKEEKPKTIKVEIILDIDLFEKIKDKDIKKYLEQLIKNDMI